nr:uncharacterized protein LOC109766024 isoform X3 [Aegilops tauschii subsp. strangulata]
MAVLETPQRSCSHVKGVARALGHVYVVAVGMLPLLLDLGGLGREQRGRGHLRRAHGPRLQGRDLLSNLMRGTIPVSFGSRTHLRQNGSSAMKQLYFLFSTLL